jgi:hypothetical protein
MHICQACLAVNTIDVTHFHVERIIEICAVQVSIGKSYIIAVYVYRSPSGNFLPHFKCIDLGLKTLT